MIMRKALTLSLLLLLALGGACNQKNEATTAENTEAAAPPASTVAEHQLTPEELGELGAHIKKTPERAGELLSAHGLNEKSFESQIRKVTEDPEASKRYAEAYKKASA
jgi:hypothetical protein